MSSLKGFHRASSLRAGFLSQVSSLRLPLVHSGQVLTLSNAAHTSLPSPLLLGTYAGVCAASPLGVTIRHVICGFIFFLFIFPPTYVVL